jgi:serine/threonine protein kinase
MIKSLTLEQFKEQYEVNFKAKKGDENFLGAGGFGNVYRGWDKTKHEAVAIKKSKEEQNLVEEVERVLQIPRHKNIAYYETAIRVEAEPDDFEISVMKYYPKGSLKSVIDTETLSDQQKKDIVRGILDGLHFLHEELKDEQNKPMRLVHRDLKPPKHFSNYKPPRNIYSPHYRFWYQ